MALGSYIPLYAWVIEQLMQERREQELLLLMAIAKFADPFGFCWPGRINLMKMRHCSQRLYEQRMAWLQEQCYVVVVETYDYRRRQPQFDMQISPRALYVRPEVQAYCEAIFDSVQERDFGAEKKFLEILLRTKESQPESLPESETRAFKPDSGTSAKTRRHNQLSTAPEQKGRAASTMRNGAKPEKREAQQPTATDREAHRETTPQAVPRDEFQSLLSPTVDDDRLADEIRLAVGTTKHQAADAVKTYSRETLVHWLGMAARRRQAGTITKPGAWFFAMLRKNAAPRDDYGDLP